MMARCWTGDASAERGEGPDAADAGHDPSVPRPDRSPGHRRAGVKVVVDALDINALLARIDVSALSTG